MSQNLTYAFYEVLCKYEKHFAERGVVRNLTNWYEHKQNLIDLLRHHPDWNEEELCIVFDLTETREINPAVVDEKTQQLLALARTNQLDGERLENFMTAITAATADHAVSPSQDNVDIITQHAGIRCNSSQKSSRIVNRICEAFGVTRFPRYPAVFAQLSDALSPNAIRKTGILSVHPCDYLLMSYGNSWQSCHRIDGGMHASGTI